MDEIAESTAKKTVKQLDERFMKIEEGQRAAASQHAALRVVVDRQAEEQKRMQLQLDEVCRKQSAADGMGSVGGGSVSSGSTRAPKPNFLAGFASAPAAGPNPYQSPVVDKSLVIIGGWRENIPNEVISSDVAKILALFNATGHICELDEIRCPNRAKFASVVFKEGSSEGTAAKQAFGFTGWMRSLAVAAKPVCTGSGTPVWSAINQSIEDRTKSRTIKRGLRCLHLLREELSVPAKVFDLGCEVNLLEGARSWSFRGRSQGSNLRRGCRLPCVGL